jgi:hypothetical protein
MRDYQSDREEKSYNDSQHPSPSTPESNTPNLPKAQQISESI